jgi:hypothetical protein
MRNDPEPPLTPAEMRDLQRVAATMVPASAEYDVPGADDPTIFADIVASIGRDMADVRKALVALREVAGGAFADAEPSRADTAAEALRDAGGAPRAAIERVILQCYYRDDRVLRSLNIEPRPPFPKGHVLEQGDWSLLDPVRTRPKLWRDAPR